MKILVIVLLCLGLSLYYLVATLVYFVMFAELDDGDSPSDKGIEPPSPLVWYSAFWFIAALLIILVMIGCLFQILFMAYKWGISLFKSNPSYCYK